MRGLVQIAGVRDLREAGMLLAAGVHQLGFPLGREVRRGEATAAEAAAMLRSLGPAVSAVLITYRSRADDLIALCRETGFRKVQLHGEIALSELKRLRTLDRGLFIIKSLIVGREPPDVLADLARSCAPYVDAFITDTYDRATGACGATGKTHDWTVSRRLAEVSTRPVILAGGLNPANVRQAIAAVRPAGVDAHTGVEGPDGRKDERRVGAFVREATEAFAGTDQKP